MVGMPVAGVFPAGYLVAPERYREDLRSLAEDEDGLKALAMFVATGRFPEDFTQRFVSADFEPLVVALGAALRRVGLTDECAIGPRRI